MADDEMSNFTPGLAIASCLHETQASRVFRS
jgi:urease accessory protein UreF